jgi:hypothetical protein
MNATTPLLRRSIPSRITRWLLVRRGSSRYIGEQKLAMMDNGRSAQLHIFSLTALAAVSLGMSVFAQPSHQPVDPGVPIGCLLSPECGSSLFKHPDGQKVSVQAPVDPAKSVPCLLNPTCSGALDLPAGRGALFSRQVTLDEVARHGAQIGDYITFNAGATTRVGADTGVGRAAAPRSTSFSLPSGSGAAPCTTSLTQASEISEKASNLPPDIGTRRNSFNTVVTAYTEALKACGALP